MADSAQPAAGITPYPGFTRLAVGTLSSNPAVGWLELARPDKFNAFDAKMWEEFPRVRSTAKRPMAALWSVPTGGCTEKEASVAVPGDLSFMCGGLRASAPIALPCRPFGSWTKMSKCGW